MRELSQSRLALGSNIILAITTDMTDLDADNLFKNLWQRVFLFEKRFSRFLPMSELSIFNRLTGTKKPISPAFKDLLTKALQLGKETNGLFNPFIVPVLQRAGYMKSAVPGYENDINPDYTNRRVVDIDQLCIGEDWAQIPFGTSLDMGGCGKGYLADRLADILSETSIQGYWLSLGGDIVTMGRDKNGDNIKIGIQNANNPDDVTDWVVNCPLKRSATATSGTFRSKGQEFIGAGHHIIDPQTLKPAVTDIQLATICADTTLKADVFASCAVMLGSKKAPAFLKENGIKSALLQCKDSKGDSFVKVIGSLIKKNHSYKPREISKNA